MLEIIRSKLVKVRKQHRCFGCYSKIKKGEIAEINTNVYDDTIYDIYFCKNCLKYQKKYCNKCKDECTDLENMFDEGYIKYCKERND